MPLLDVKNLKVNFVTRKLVFHLRQTAKGVVQDVIFHILEKEHSKIDHICITPGKATGSRFAPKRRR